MVPGVLLATLLVLLEEEEEDVSVGAPEDGLLAAPPPPPPHATSRAAPKASPDRLGAMFRHDLSGFFMMVTPSKNVEHGHQAWSA
jgi:hypothetical protein